MGSAHLTTMNQIKITRKCPKAPCGGRISTFVEKAGVVESRCPVCDEPVKFDVPTELVTAGDGVVGTAHPTEATHRDLMGTAQPTGVVTRCACCPGREFFIRKDFPQRLGLVMVVLFGLVATFFYAYEQIAMTFATLGSLVVIDAIIFFFVGKVTVCYRCRAEYRGVAYNPDHEGFDLATSEKY